MKKSKFSDTQIVSILKGAEAGIPVKEVCRQHQISSACYYKCEIEIRWFECVMSFAEIGNWESREQQAQTHVRRDGDGKSRV